MTLLVCNIKNREVPKITRDVQKTSEHFQRVHTSMKQMNQGKVVSRGTNETLDTSLSHYYSSLDGMKQRVLTSI